MTLSKSIFKKTAPLLFLSLFLSACSVPFITKKAAIQITSNPQATVSLNNSSVGQTPAYQEKLSPGEYTIKLTPSDVTLQPWEGRVTLTGGTLSIVDYQLSSNPDQVQGYTMFFETLPQKTAVEFKAVSFPNTASVLVDGKPAGFTPLSTNSVTPGSHTFTFTAPGYQEKVVKAAIKEGFALSITVQLATQTIDQLNPIITPSPAATPSATPKLTPTPTVATGSITPIPKQKSTTIVKKPYITILSTPTGWLRVRDQAEVSGTEIAKVNPNDKFPYLEASASSGWYQIEYLEGKTGWVSGKYAELVE